jgi:hypothetical protein
MTTQRRKPSASKSKPETIEDPLKAPVEVPELETIAPTGKIFLGEEDKRLLKKFNRHIVNKLGLGGNRSFKI